MKTSKGGGGSKAPDGGSKTPGDRVIESGLGQK